MILDALFETNGQNLQSLCQNVAFSRQGLSSHLKVLEGAGLVITEFRGREKLHYLNPVPIHEMTERWIAKYSRDHLDAIATLKRGLEGATMKGREFAYETYINCGKERVWEALTNAEFTSQFFYATHVESSWVPGSAIYYRYSNAGEIAVDGKVLEADPPNKLVISWHVNYDEDAKLEAPSRVTFSLQDCGHQTRLRIVHDQFPEDSVLFNNISKGWPWILASLKSLLETGEALPPLVDEMKEAS